jgi:hypothetical protein
MGWPMISVILTAGDDARGLSRLLTALVPGAAHALIRGVAVVGAAGLSWEIADDAGADLYDAGAFAEAYADAKGPWVAGLPLGADLETGWVETLTTHVNREPPTPARLVSASGGITLRARPEGWLAPKRLAGSAVAAEQDLQRIARVRGSRALRILSLHALRRR